ncbi:hypothetical protein EDB85DRAFT_2162874 [Lactarius pseudohatsudake]|nr:hypothetical protein EDB85DRAFT_2162874 [Lactarius pseudohatsudake]
MHALVHSFDDIEAKGASRNYNTKPNEKMHGFLRKLYLNWTNFKNVASQILKHKHVALVGELIRGQINELNAAIREQATNDDSDDIGGDALGSTQGQHISSSLEPPVQGGSSCQGRRSMFDARAVILRSQQAPVTFEALEVRRAQDRPFRNFRARLTAWLTDTMPLYRFSFTPDCTRVEFQVDDKIAWLQTDHVEELESLRGKLQQVAVDLQEVREAHTLTEKASLDLSAANAELEGRLDTNVMQTAY